MIQPIQFLKPEYHPKAWGDGEIWITNNDRYCAKILKFNKGKSFSFHYHFDKGEYWYIVKGQLLMKYFDLSKADELEKILNEGDIVYIPPGNPHKLTALQDSDIFEVSDHHEDSDSYRIGKGRSQGATG